MKQNQKLKEIFTYFNVYIDEEKLRKYYIQSKFDILIDKSKRDFFEQKANFNAFTEIENEEELKELEKCIEIKIKEQANFLLTTLKHNYYGIKNEKLEDSIDKILLEIKLLNSKNKELRKIKRQLEVESKKVIKLPTIRTNKSRVLLDNSLLKNYILIDIEQNLRENEKYIKKMFIFNVHELRLTKKQTEYKEDSANFKILYAYLTQMVKDDNYSIEEIRNVLERFEIYDERNIELLCKVHKLDNILEILKTNTNTIMDSIAEIDKKQIDERFGRFKIKLVSNISTNIVKIRLIPNEYINFPIPYFGMLEEKITKEEQEEREELDNKFEEGMKTFDFFNGLREEAGEEIRIIESSPLKYKETIEPTLKELGIWSKLLSINEKQEYVIAISLDDFSQIPIDKSKLEKVEDIDIRSNYLDEIIEELEDLIEYVIPDENNNTQKLGLKTKLHIIKSSINQKYILEKKTNIPRNIEEELKYLNKLTKHIIDYIQQKLRLDEILKYGKQKLSEIDKTWNFEQSIKEIERINIINKYIPVDYNTTFYEAYIVKKFEILCRNILRKENRKLENPNIEEILKRDIDQYCSQNEKENYFLQEFQIIIQSIIIEKKENVPIKDDILNTSICHSIKEEFFEVIKIILQEIKEVRVVEEDER